MDCRAMSRRNCVAQALNCRRDVAWHNCYTLRTASMIKIRLDFVSIFERMLNHATEFLYK